jgi:hypothetical protein
MWYMLRSLLAAWLTGWYFILAAWKSMQEHSKLDMGETVPGR